MGHWSRPPGRFFFFNGHTIYKLSYTPFLFLPLVYTALTNPTNHNNRLVEWYPKILALWVALVSSRYEV